MQKNATFDKKAFSLHVPVYNNHFKEMSEEMLIAACLSYYSIRALLLNKSFTERNREFRLLNVLS